jgi:hypothetical protein
MNILPQASGAHNLLAHEMRDSALAWSWTHDQPKRRDPLMVRCSELDNCLRAVAYSALGTPIDNPWDLNTREKLEKGNLLQDRIRGFLIPELTSWWVSCWKPEVELSLPVPGAEVPLVGHPDGILNHKFSGERALLEVKSTSSFGYNSVCKGAFTNPEDYSMGYWRQANRYFQMWNRLFPKHSVDTICILLYNVNGNEDPLTEIPLRDYWFDGSKAAFEEDLKRVRHLEEALRHEKLPAREYALDHWRCKGCLWKHRCWDLPGAPPDPRGPAAAGNVSQAVRPVARRPVSRRPRVVTAGAR